MERGKAVSLVLRKKRKEEKSFKRESTKTENSFGLTHSSDEISVTEMERRGQIILLRLIDQPEMGGISGSGKAV
jgi:hypothetical protein